MMSWSYLCRWHFYLTLLLRHDIGFCDPSPNDVVEYHCDWRGCKRKPYREVYPNFRRFLEANKSKEYVPISG